MFACHVYPWRTRSVVLNLSLCLFPCWSRASLALCLLEGGILLAAPYLAASEHTFVFFTVARPVHAPLD